MFQLWIGPKQGQTSEIIPNLEKDDAFKQAREKVSKANEEGKQLLVSIFDVFSGTVIGGFATPGLRSQLKNFKQIQILEAAHEIKLEPWKTGSA